VGRRQFRSPSRASGILRFNDSGARLGSRDPWLARVEKSGSRYPANRNVDIDPIENWPRQASEIPSTAIGSARAIGRRIASIAARTGVSREHQLNVGWKLRHLSGAVDGDYSRFKGLAEGVENSG